MYGLSWDVQGSCWHGHVHLFSAVIWPILLFTRKGTTCLILFTYVTVDQRVCCTLSQEKSSALWQGCEEDKFPATFATGVSAKLLYYSGESAGEKHEIYKEPVQAADRGDSEKFLVLI